MGNYLRADGILHDNQADQKSPSRTPTAGKHVQQHGTQSSIGQQPANPAGDLHVCAGVHELTFHVHKWPEWIYTCSIAWSGDDLFGVPFDDLRVQSKPEEVRGQRGTWIHSQSDPRCPI